MLKLNNKSIINSFELGNFLKFNRSKNVSILRNLSVDNIIQEKKENRKRNYASKSFFNKDPELNKKLKEIESKFLKEENEKKIFFKRAQIFKKSSFVNNELPNEELLTTEKFKKGLENYEELYEENFDPNKVESDPDVLRIQEEFLNSRNFEDVNLEIYKELIKDEKDKEKIEQIIQTYELEKYDTGRVPSFISIEEMGKLKNYSPNEIDSFLGYLFLKEARKYITKKKKEINKKVTFKVLSEKYKDTQKRTGLEFNKDGAPIYGKWKNSLVINLSKEILRKEYLNNLVRSVMFGPNLVFDFDYFDVMKEKNYNSLASQIGYSLGPNQSLKEPFYYNFCNYPKNNQFDKVLRKFIPNIYSSEHLINITEKSYLDLFDKSNLIYLSPDANDVLQTIDFNKTYIIGALNDKGHIKNYSLEKARRENIPVYSLPLEQYFFFKQDRVLTINAVVKILCKYKLTNCWKKSLINNIPFRKLKTPEELRSEQENRIKKYFSKKKNFQRKFS